MANLSMLTQVGQEATESNNKPQLHISSISGSQFNELRRKHTVDTLEHQVHKQDDDNPKGF